MICKLFLLFVFASLAPLAPFAAGKAYAASTCTLTATPINFPLYDSSVAVIATGTVTVSCTTPPFNVRYTVSLGPSSGSGSVNPRALKHQTVPDTLTYTITTPATTQGTPAGALWGDGTLGTIVVTERFNASATLTMTCNIPAGQDMTQGLYTDSITATVTP